MDLYSMKLQPVKGKREWILLEDISHTFTSLDYDVSIIVPKGFRFDGASTPRVCWWFGTPMGTDTLPGALFHDYIYRTHLYPRDIADQFFNELMMKSGVGFFKRNLFYLGVRIGGWLTYYYTGDYVKKTKGKT